MITINRRRVMGNESGGSPTWQSYVQDGLVFQLDGIEKGTTDTDKWVDLIGSKVFIPAFDDGIQTMLENGVEFGSSKGGLKCTTTLIGDTSYTVEAALVINSYWSTKGVFQSGNRNLSIVFRYDKVMMFGSAAAPSWDLSDKPTKLTVSMTGSLAVANKVLLTSTGTFSNQWTTREFEVGYIQNSNNHFIGIIHAIRIYNRPLTESEMLHNQQVDNERFNLGLT